MSRIEVVLDLHDGFTSLDEREKFTALLILETLLIEGPVEVWQQDGDLVDIVLQGNGETARMGLIGQPGVVVDMSFFFL